MWWVIIWLVVGAVSGGCWWYYYIADQNSTVKEAVGVVVVSGICGFSTPIVLSLFYVILLIEDLSLSIWDKKIKEEKIMFLLIWMLLGGCIGAVMFLKNSSDPSVGELVLYFSSGAFLSWIALFLGMFAIACLLVFWVSAIFIFVRNKLP